MKSVLPALWLATLACAGPAEPVADVLQIPGGDAALVPLASTPVEPVQPTTLAMDGNLLPNGVPVASAEVATVTGLAPDGRPWPVYSPVSVPTEPTGDSKFAWPFGTTGTIKGEEVDMRGWPTSPDQMYDDEEKQEAFNKRVLQKKVKMPKPKPMGTAPTAAK